MKLKQWLSELKYLPEFMRDFHDQKDLFKTIHQTYDHGDENNKNYMPNWVQAHTYTIDWFLWFMASRGYTLQKSRAKIDFKEMPDCGRIQLNKQVEFIKSIIETPKDGN